MQDNKYKMEYKIRGVGENLHVASSTIPLVRFLFIYYIHMF